MIIIMSIQWSLVSLLGILTIIMGTLAIPFKTMIDFDISGQRPIKVKVTPSEAYPGGIHYTTVQGSRHTHILGAIMDGEEVLVDGDPTAVSRYILVQNRQDGVRYVRVMTRWRAILNTLRTAIKEFVKTADGHYMQISRMPMELNILTQDIDQNVHAELLGNWEEHDKRPGVMPADIETLPILFTIQPEVALHAMIGVVRFGHYILDGHADGLILREVTWEGGLDAPIITITSRYKNGKGTETKYRFLNEEKGFIPYWSRNIALKFYE